MNNAIVTGWGNNRIRSNFKLMQHCKLFFPIFIRETYERDRSGGEMRKKSKTKKEKNMK